MWCRPSYFFDPDTKVSFSYDEYTPLTVDRQANMIRKTTVLDTKNMMVSCNARTKQASLAKYISILNIIQGEVHESFQRIRERKLVNFIEWGPASIQVSGLMLASYTGIRHLYAKRLSQYSLLGKRQAFLDKYKSFPVFADNDLSEFDESKDLIDSLDPDHNLTDEGNVVGMVDPTLQFT
ncbi:tubulin gamma-2 chain [Artemisia annua]|uniref:Tubulin gamma-2 chain n=1 Tax=Artemisia annua TaxID=35608 RepID=A0A2U1PM38_ARTAN|nr:tubulin gamma-2 chain [Artemisia annua]